ncbi:MAG: FtsX-like permease family protein [Dorea formicigenerans]
MKSADQKIYVSDTAQYTAVSKFAGGYEMVILGTIGILCGIYFLVRNVLWISMSEDIQNLGLLHTIGATERQITKIYRKQMRSLMLKGSVFGKLDFCTDFDFIDTENIRLSFLSGNGRKYDTFLFQTVDSFDFCSICKWNSVDSIGRCY